MKRIFKLLPLVAGILFFFTQCEKEAATDMDDALQAESVFSLKAGHNTADCYVEQDLWAGAGQNDLSKGTLVGKVVASITGSELTVEYIVDAPWYATETHLWVGNKIDRRTFPRQAAPGQFPYSGDKQVNPLVFKIDLTGFTPGKPIYISAHAVVSSGVDGVEGLEALLPEHADFKIVLNKNTSYLTATLSNAGILDGIFDSYCINPEILISENTMYKGEVSSSLTPPAGLVTYPDNFGKVNWIINNITTENYSYADIQVAIWKVLFGTWASNVGNRRVVEVSDPLKVDEIIAAADADFVPGCGDYLAVIVWDKKVQPIIVWKKIVCGGGTETAWAFGPYAFNNRTINIAQKWGWIFEMNYCE